MNQHHMNKRGLGFLPLLIQLEIKKTSQFDMLFFVITSLNYVPI